MFKIYGIKNCSTMKKAFDWLDGAGVRYTFHDYKKLGIDEATLSAWEKKVGWQVLLNTRGTTWRGLSPEQQADMSREKAIGLMANLPSLIKRPVLDCGTNLLVGFNPDAYAAALKD